MIAPESRGRLTPPKAMLSEPITTLELDEQRNPARTLADLYRRCGRGGECPYSLDQLIRVLSALCYHGRAEAGDLATDARLPASATYGCVLELEDYGLSRWIPRPLHLADHQTAEITVAGLRLLREINTGGRG